MHNSKEIALALLVRTHLKYWKFQCLVHQESPYQYSKTIVCIYIYIWWFRCFPRLSEFVTIPENRMLIVWKVWVVLSSHQGRGENGYGSFCSAVFSAKVLHCLEGTKGVPRKGVWTSVDMRVWTLKEWRVKHYQTSCCLRPPFLGNPLVPSRVDHIIYYVMLLYSILIYIYIYIYVFLLGPACLFRLVSFVKCKHPERWSLGHCKRSIGNLRWGRCWRLERQQVQGEASIYSSLSNFVSHGSPSSSPLPEQSLE